MADFAIVEISGKQYKAVAGGELIVDRLSQDIGGIIFEKVLLVSTDGAVKIGTPYVAGASVSAKVVAQEKDEKIYVVKYKAKSRYRRRTGFRAQLTRIAIDKIMTGAKSAEATKTTQKAPRTVKRSSK
ncbi:50S ribosomal protein L21 [Candidatus Microgenomates bacterium]|nr:50S ribosomal protein L21 [Candidatus Microgenomates bacterium]